MLWHAFATGGRPYGIISTRTKIRILQAQKPLHREKCLLWRLYYDTFSSLCEFGMNLALLLEEDHADNGEGTRVLLHLTVILV
jgi:hypothetical protein